MNWADTVTYIILPILAGIGAIWALVAKVIVPNYLKALSLEQQHQQSAEVSALSQVLSMNEQQGKALIEAVQSFSQYKKEAAKLFDSLERKIEQSLMPLANVMAKSNTAVTVGNMERVRQEEILSDIDQQLHDIKALLEYNRGMISELHKIADIVDSIDDKLEGVAHDTKDG